MTRYPLGPWTLQDAEDRRSKTIIVYAKGWRPVARVPERAGEDTEALANLIAAAPDMYVALETIDAFLKDNAVESDYYPPHLDEAQELVAAALRKARGEETKA